MLFHFFMPYMQHCYGNTCLMLYSLHLDIAYLVCFHPSFWSIASSDKSFWMPFPKGYAPWAEDIERGTARLYFLCFFPKIGLGLSLAISSWWTTCSSLEYLSDAQVQPVYRWRKHVSSAPELPPHRASQHHTNGFSFPAHMRTHKAHNHAWNKCPQPSFNLCIQKKCYSN